MGLIEQALANRGITVETATTHGEEDGDAGRPGGWFSPLTG